MKKEDARIVFDETAGRSRCSGCGKFVREPDPSQRLPGNTNYHYHTPAAHINPNTRNKQ